MEHRHHVRTPVDISTLIYQCGLPIATGRIRNASRRGLFIQTDYGALQAHQRVLCEMHAGGEPGVDMRRVSVRVVRCAPEGAGVEVEEEDGPVANAVIACARPGNATQGSR